MSCPIDQDTIDVSKAKLTSKHSLLESKCNKLIGISIIIDPAANRFIFHWRERSSKLLLKHMKQLGSISLLLYCTKLLTIGLLILSTHLSMPAASLHIPATPVITLDNDVVHCILFNTQKSRIKKLLQ